VAIPPRTVPPIVDRARQDPRGKNAPKRQHPLNTKYVNASSNETRQAINRCRTWGFLALATRAKAGGRLRRLLRFDTRSPYPRTNLVQDSRGMAHDDAVPGDTVVIIAKWMSLEMIQPAGQLRLASRQANGASTNQRGISRGPVCEPTPKRRPSRMSLPMISLCETACSC
jgi:hypothetical protein